MNNKVGLFEHFRLLLSFRGREDVGSFWPYAALVFGGLTMLNMLSMIPLMAMSVGNILDSGMPPDASTFMLYFAAMTMVGVLLYVAAVVRRLRDSGRSPWWARVLLPFAIGSGISVMQMMGSPFDGFGPDLTMIQLMIASNVLETLSIVALIFMLTMRSASLTSTASGERKIPHYHEE